MTKRLWTERWFIERASGLYDIGAIGLLYNPGAWWIGVHYSPGNKRFCVNLIPCLTIWYTKPGGNEP